MQKSSFDVPCMEHVHVNTRTRVNKRTGQQLQEDTQSEDTHRRRSYTRWVSINIIQLSLSFMSICFAFKIRGVFYSWKRIKLLEYNLTGELSRSMTDKQKPSKRSLPKVLFPVWASCHFIVELTEGVLFIALLLYQVVIRCGGPPATVSQYQEACFDFEFYKVSTLSCLSLFFFLLQAHGDVCQQRFLLKCLPFQSSRVFPQLFTKLLPQQLLQHHTQLLHLHHLHHHQHLAPPPPIHLHPLHWLPALVEGTQQRADESHRRLHLPHGRHGVVRHLRVHRLQLRRLHWSPDDAVGGVQHVCHHLLHKNALSCPHLRGALRGCRSPHHLHESEQRWWYSY